MEAKIRNESEVIHTDEIDLDEHYILIEGNPGGIIYVEKMDNGTYISINMSEGDMDRRWSTNLKSYLDNKIRCGNIVHVFKRRVDRLDKLKELL